MCVLILIIVILIVMIWKFTYNLLCDVLPVATHGHSTSKSKDPKLIVSGRLSPPSRGRRPRPPPLVLPPTCLAPENHYACTTPNSHLVLLRGTAAPTPSPLP